MTKIQVPSVIFQSPLYKIIVELLDRPDPRAPDLAKNPGIADEPTALKRTATPKQLLGDNGLECMRKACSSKEDRLAEFYSLAAERQLLRGTMGASNFSNAPRRETEDEKKFMDAMCDWIK